MGRKMCKGKYAAHVKIILPFAVFGNVYHMDVICVYKHDSCRHLNGLCAYCALTFSHKRHNYIYITKREAMAKNRASRKTEALRQHGSLNPHPKEVHHELFQSSEFFDSADLMQVKYEMLR